MESLGSPAARHSHASAVIPSEQGLLYMFGGCLQEPGKSSDKSTVGVVINDVWAYDQAAQGWEEVQFQASPLGCDLPADAQAIHIPAGRAGHSMMAMRTGALTCGGYGYASDGRSKTYLADDAGRMECWWFTPGTPARWDKLKLSGSSAASAPEPRSFHAMSYDTIKQRFIVFGGQTNKGQLLNDCWELSLSQGSGVDKQGSLEYQSQYNWTTCDPPSALSLRPQARYAHQSVYFHHSLWLVGGFAQNGLRIAAMQDIWTLRLGEPPSGLKWKRTATPPDDGQEIIRPQLALVLSGKTELTQQEWSVFGISDLRAKQWVRSGDSYFQPVEPGASWHQVMPTTAMPDARGFHAMWLSGHKIVLHGGQGPTGSGTAAVLGDTWLFDLFTMEWTQKGTSAAVPFMSHLSINPLDQAAQAVSFGGRNLYGKPSGRLYTFSGTKSTAWKRVYPAGRRPSRRTGHSLFYDRDSARLIVSFGLDSKGMQEDTWILDLGTSMWMCWHGSDPTCKHQAPHDRYRGPGKIAFPAQVQVGIYAFLFGGAQVPRASLALALSLPGRARPLV